MTATDKNHGISRSMGKKHLPHRRSINKFTARIQALVKQQAVH